MRILFIGIWLFIILPGPGVAQVNHALKLEASDVQSLVQLDEIKYKKKVKNEKEARKELQGVLFRLIEEGFTTASIDSVYSDSLETHAIIFIGNRYEIIRLDPGNIDPIILAQSGYKAKYFTGKAFDYADLARLNRNIIKHCENTGYPFASVKLDSIVLEEGKISARLKLNKNYRITIDSIVIKGSSKLKRGYLYNYLDIKPGHLYNESRISKVDQKIGELQFVQEIRPFEIGFTDEEATLYLYLDKKKASQFDGFIGIAPNSERSGKLLITGDIKLKLISIFNRGETLEFNWRSLESQTQDLRLNVGLPYLFSTPFGVDYTFKLLKQDTSYITLNNTIGIQYYFASDNFLKVYLEATSSSLLNTSQYEDINTLPPFADVKTSNYGLEYFRSKLDYRYNPRKGFYLNPSASFGIKNIRQNNALNPEIYDSLALRSNIYKGGFDAGVFIPVFRQGTFMLSTMNALISGEDLFENELYRIGGLRSLRGFDEESIFASSFSIVNIEFRLLIDRNSFFSVFWNGAFYEQNSTSGYVQDTPWGFGAGLSFDTRAGIFSLYYAMGTQFDNPIEFKSAKVHFGYSSTF